MSKCKSHYSSQHAQHKAETPASFDAQAAKRQFNGANKTAMSKAESISKSSAQLKAAFDYVLKNHAGRGRILDNAELVFASYIENGLLAAIFLQQKFTKILLLKSSDNDGRKLISIAFNAAGQEMRFLLDATDAAKPIFLRIGNSQDINHYLGKFRASMAVAASQNGCASMFLPLAEYREALAREKV